MNDNINKVERVIGRTLSPVEFQMVCELFESYTEEDILRYVELAKFKDRPINYARTIIIKECKHKDQPSGSEWWDNLKKQLEEDEKKPTGSQWLEEFKKQFK